ncbi:somatostatin receptor type 5-like [Pelobates fuscus]|uniref:somatostatin receptor type 5-like n=1 Tax=Pelobates fuscus TaxID=191477 RepID=UPI002FE43776
MNDSQILDYSLDYNYTDFLDYNFTLEDDFRDSKQNTLFCVIYVLVCVVGFVSNALAIYVVLRYRYMWTTTNIYISSLVLGDLLYMLCLLWFAVETAYSYWSMGIILCKVFWALTTSVAFSSSFFLTIISINDCLQVYFPVFSRNRLGPKAALVISGCTWVICLLLGIPIFRYASLDSGKSCKVWSEATSLYSITITTYQFVLAFFVPLALVCVSLILTANWLKSHKKHADPSYTNVREDMILVLALSIVYVVIWLPMHVLEIMSAVGVFTELTETVYYLLSIVPYLKCCIYPFLYGLISQSFNDGYKRVLCCAKAKTINKDTECCGDKQEDKCLN